MKLGVFIILTVLLAINSYALSVQEAYKNLLQLSYPQRVVLFKVFKKAKPFDLQYTMTAIAWQESDFGKYLINVTDGNTGSYGIFHNLLSSVCSRHTCNNWKRSRVAERLIFDMDFSFAEALAELKYWENYWTSKNVSKIWTHMVCSYNAGHNWKNGIKYKNKIVIRIKALKLFMKEYQCEK